MTAILDGQHSRTMSLVAGTTTPAFLISIDTEGDDVWARPRSVKTRNAAFLPRFQALCESFGFKPTYLTNWEMASSPVFRAFAEDVLRREAGGIGMHLHGWDNPPIIPLTYDDAYYQPYLPEYPQAVIEEKVTRVTRLLEDSFGRKITSHRAGRWGLDARYVNILIRHGYTVDCSVSPNVSWRQTPGDPAQTGGPDFTAFPNEAYRMDADDIGKVGDSPLLELPMTIMRRKPNFLMSMVRNGVGKSPDRVVWLRPNGRNLQDMLWIIEQARREKRPYIQFTLHSSEFMPGGSPTFKTEKSIEQLYRHMYIIFTAISKCYSGATLDEYAKGILAAA